MLVTATGENVLINEYVTNSGFATEESVSPAGSNSTSIN